MGASFGGGEPGDEDQMDHFAQYVVASVVKED